MGAWRAVCGRFADTTQGQRERVRTISLQSLCQHSPPFPITAIRRFLQAQTGSPPAGVPIPMLQLSTPKKRPSEAASSTPSGRLTPMFAQYLEIKKNYPDALLFYRMGDFYELFFEDAEIAARELQIALTSRNPHAEQPIAMCGVPWHSAQNYANQLVNKGYTVAFCDQVQDPREARGLVERAVTRVVTSGTTVEDGSLEAKTHSYLAAAWRDPDAESGAVAWLDASTGEWSGIQTAKDTDLWQWTLKMAPRELLVPEGMELPAALKNRSNGEIRVVRLPVRSHFDLRRAGERLLAAQGVQETAALGLDTRPALLRACGALLAYLEQTQMQDPRHLAPFVPLDVGRHLVIDEVTERNLELFRRLDGRKGAGTLRQVLDHTRTPMGGRLLEERIRNPWRDASAIAATQDAVAWLVQNEELRDRLGDALHAVYDMERLSTRVALNRATPQDFCALRASCASLPKVQKIVMSHQEDFPTAQERHCEHLPACVRKLLENWDALPDITDLLNRSLVDSPPAQITDGGLFKSGYNDTLDELLDLVNHGENRLNALLEAEQVQLPKLKMGYNRVFGYFFELSKAAGGVVPEHFIRRQTLASSERFTTPELNELEQKLLSAADKRKSLEYKLFQNLREQVARARPRLLHMARLLAGLDFWRSLAETAARHHWIRPELDNSGNLHIIEGRHPVVEDIIGENAFVPNDFHMDEKRRILLITGPNMSGKSTVLRQTALICLLAQMGSFVPAREARIGICDRIFSRVGASDNLAQGQSTFMVEMMETARILRQATKRSLVILDEIGRGTSTFDGLALAWAVVEDLAKRAGGNIRTLFATHYHELTALEGQIPGVHTMNIAIQESGNDIVFLRRLVPGPSDRSYGIEVARLAGVPHPVVQRAKAILARLERTRDTVSPLRKAMPGLLPGLEAAPLPPSPPPAPEHPLLVALRDLQPETLTPIEALNRLAEWKTLWGNK